MRITEHQALQRAQPNLFPSLASASPCVNQTCIRLPPEDIVSRDLFDCVTDLRELASLLHPLVLYSEARTLYVQFWDRYCHDRVHLTDEVIGAHTA
jgi:hypothetical protein